MSICRTNCSQAGKQAAHAVSSGRTTTVKNPAWLSSTPGLDLRGPREGGGTLGQGESEGAASERGTGGWTPRPYPLDP